MAGPGGISVGKVTVKVSPDTSKFPAELRAELARIKDDFKVDVGLDTSPAAAEFETLKKRIESDTINADLKINQRKNLTTYRRTILKIQQGLTKIQSGFDNASIKSEAIASNMVSARQAMGTMSSLTARWAGQLIKAATSADNASKAWAGLTARVRSTVTIGKQQINNLAQLSRNLANIAKNSTRLQGVRLKNFVRELDLGGRAAVGLVTSFENINKVAKKTDHALLRTMDGLQFSVATIHRGLIRTGLEFENMPRLAAKAQAAVIRIGLEMETLPDRLKKSLSTGIIRTRLEMERLADSVGNSLRKAPQLAAKGYRDLQVAAIRAGMAVRRVQDFSFSKLTASGRRGFQVLQRGFASLASTIGNLMDSGISGLGSVFSSIFSAMGSGAGQIAKMASGLAAVGSALLGVVAGLGIVFVVGTVIAAIAGALAILVGLVIAAVGAIVVGFAGLPVILGLVAGGAAAVILGMDGIKKAAETLNPQIESLKKRLSDTFEKGLTPVFERLKGIFPAIEDGLDGIAQKLVNAASGLADMAMSAENMQNLKNAFSGIKMTMDEMAPGLQGLTQSLLDIAGTEIYYKILGDTIGSVSQKFADFFDHLRTSGDLANGLIIVWNVLDGLTDSVLALAQAATDFFIGAGPGVARFFDELANAIGRMDWESLGQTFGDMFNRMADAIANISTEDLNVLLDSIGSIATSVGDFAARGGFTEIITGLSLLFDAVSVTMDMVSGFLDVMKSVASGLGFTWDLVSLDFQGLTDRMKGSSEDAKNGVTTSFQQMQTGVADSTAGVKQDVLNMHTGVTESVSRTGDEVQRTMKDGMQGMSNEVSAGVRRSADQAARLPGEAKSAVGPTKGVLKGSGMSLVDGFVQGIRVSISAVKSAAKAVVDAARAFFPFSPAKTGPFSGKGYTTYSGRALVLDFASGIESATPKAVKAVDNMMSAANARASSDFTGHIEGDGFGVTGSVYEGVMAAFNGSRLQVDGSGMAKLVNKTNNRNNRR